MTSRSVLLTIAGAELTGILERVLRQDVELLRSKGTSSLEVEEFIEWRRDELMVFVPSWDELRVPFLPIVRSPNFGDLFLPISPPRFYL